MADGETDTLELTQDLVVAPVDDGADATAAAQTEVDQTESQGEEIGFDDDAAPASEQSDLVKHLRKVAREQAAKIRELSGNAPAPQTLGKKPDLWEDCEGDQDRFERELLAWNEAKRTQETAQAEQERRQQEVQQKYEEKFQLVENAAERLNIADFNDARDAVELALTPHQFMTLTKAASDPGRLIAALGKSPERLAALAQQKDLIELAGDVARMETSIRTRAKPAVDRPTSGGAPAAVSIDKHLEALRLKAEKTGDDTEYFKAKRAAQRQ